MPSEDPDLDLEEWFDEVEKQRQLLYPTHSIKSQGQLGRALRNHIWSVHYALHGKRSRPLEYYLRVVVAICLIWLEKIYYEQH